MKTKEKSSMKTSMMSLTSDLDLKIKMRSAEES